MESVKETERSKECENDEHYFERVTASALEPIWNEELGWHGAGFKTWICEHCHKKVKSS